MLLRDAFQFKDKVDQVAHSMHSMGTESIQELRSRLQVGRWAGGHVPPSPPPPCASLHKHRLGALIQWGLGSSSDSCCWAPPAKKVGQGPGAEAVPVPALRRQLLLCP